MRRSKFVELVSAYLDGELSAAEMEMLREELNNNPERRALFASYRRMNEAASMADFPEVELKPVAERHGTLVTTLSWCVASSFAGVMVAFACIAFSHKASSFDDQLVAMDVAKQVVVTNDVKPVNSKPAQERSDSSNVARTPIQTILASSGFTQNPKDQFKNAYAPAVTEDPLAKSLANQSAQYSFARASVTRPNAGSLCTPVSFVSMTDH
jgi:hypothetical protein